MADALALDEAARRALRLLSAHGEVGCLTVAAAIRRDEDAKPDYHAGLAVGRHLVELGLAREGKASDGKIYVPTFALTEAGKATVREVSGDA